MRFEATAITTVIIAYFVSTILGLAGLIWWAGWCRDNIGGIIGFCAAFSPALVVPLAIALVMDLSDGRKP